MLVLSTIFLFIVSGIFNSKQLHLSSIPALKHVIVQITVTANYKSQHKNLYPPNLRGFSDERA